MNNSHNRPFDYFLAEIQNYVDILRSINELRELRREPYSLQFCLGQIDALNYVLRLGASIFKQRLKVELPDACEMSFNEYRAITDEQDALYKRIKKRG